MTSFLRAQIYICLISLIIFIETFVHFLLFLDQWLRKVDLFFHGLNCYLRLGIHAVPKRMLPLFWGPGPLIPRLTLGLVGHLHHSLREPTAKFRQLLYDF